MPACYTVGPTVTKLLLLLFRETVNMMINLSRVFFYLMFADLLHRFNYTLCLKAITCQVVADFQNSFITRDAEKSIVRRSTVC